MATDPARVVRAVALANKRNGVRKQLSPAVAQFEQMVGGHTLQQPLPRDPLQFLSGTFGPLTPMTPTPVNVPDYDDDGEGRPSPRQREMPVGWNMPIGVPGSEGFKLASFGTLRMYADLYSVSRACLQVRKSEVRGMEWDIMPTPEAEKKMRGDADAHRDFAERKDIAVKFWRKPDPDYNKFGSYIDAIIEEILAVDALSLYVHPTRKKGAGAFGSDLAALEIVAGNTIRPLVNMRGGRVRPPSPGYQQYLYGVPRSDLMNIIRGDDLKEIGGDKPVKEYRGDQLFYLPYTQRAWTPYGFPPVERSIIPTITGLRKQQFQMDFFDEGTIPGNYISPGEQLGWTPNQLEIWQNQQNALAGDPAWKHKSIALPPGSKVFPMRPVALADQFDEIVMSQVCMAFDVMPMELGVSPRVSTTQSPGAANQMAKASQDTNVRKSLKPTLAFLTDVFNIVIQEIWHQEDMRFVFEGLEENEDENSLVERLVQQVSFGFCSIDEARIALGKSPWGLPITSDPVFVSATAGMVPLGSIDPTSGKPMGTPPPAPIGAPPALGGPPAGSPAGGPPGSKPAAGASFPPAGQQPGGGGKPGTPTSNGKPGMPPPPGGLPPGAPEPNKVVNDARDAAQEAHAGVQQRIHEDFAAGKPLEPPVRPPLADANPDRPVPGKDTSKTKALMSELDTLRRHLNKVQGSPPAMADVVHDWDARYLDAEDVGMVGELIKYVPPDHACRIMAERVIQMYGPSDLAPEIAALHQGKTFDVGTPAPLVPFDLAGSDGGSHSDDCPPGCKCHIRNSGTVADLNNPVLKVGDAGPKARGQGTRVWRAWEVDKPLAAYYAARLNGALASCVNADSLARDWLESQRIETNKAYRLDGTWSCVVDHVAEPCGNCGPCRAIKAMPQPGSNWGLSWLITRLRGTLTAAIGRVLNNLWTEGFAVGREAAKEQLDSAYDSGFWDRWQPGDVDAARLAAGDGLQRMLDHYGIPTIKSIADTKLVQLADQLAAGFDSGSSADEIAKNIRPILDAPSRAQMIADTELARATSQASLGAYKEAQQQGKRWSPAKDERVCLPICAANRDQGVIPIDGLFSSGVTAPPGHPNCRCAIVPDDLDDSGVSPTSLEKAAGPVAAGLVLRAGATGRVLMIRRGETPGDPAPGCWEFPGGKLEPGELPVVAAAREWQEEVGKPLPPGLPRPGWTSSNGVYQGFIWDCGSEREMADGDRTQIEDPDGTHHEALAWVDPDEMPGPLRPELARDIVRVRASLKPGYRLGKAAPGGVDASQVYDQLLPHYPARSIAWVKRAKWSGPHDIPFDQIDHDDMDSWAASHQEEKVTGFVGRIKDGDDPNPVVLVSWQGRASLLDVDGHHRALAYRKAGKPVPAWVGVIDPADKTAVLETHSFQYTDPIPGSTSASPVNKEAIHGHHVAGTAFTYHHGWKPVDPGACLCGCGGNPKGNYLPGHDAKHVKNLVEGVKDGALSPDEALTHVAHSAKLQNKLALKLGHPSGVPVEPKPPKAKPDMGDPPDIEMHFDPVTGDIPGLDVLGDQGLFDEPGLPDDAIEVEPETPAAKKTVTDQGTTPDGRTWVSTVTPTGQGSNYHITAKPNGTAYPRDQESDFTYGGKDAVTGEAVVRIYRRAPGEDWKPDPHTPVTSIAALKQRSAVYKAAAEVMDKAHSNATATAKPDPVKPAAPALITPGPNDSLPVQGDGSASKLKKVLDSEDVPVPGVHTRAIKHKQYVTNRISTKCKASTAALVDASRVGTEDPVTSSMWKDAVKNPDAYWYTNQPYGGGINLYKAPTKSSVVGNPVTDAVLREAAISAMIHTWAESSNDHHVRSLALQEAAIDEFGLPKDKVHKWDVDMQAQVEEALKDHSVTFRAFLRAQYEGTQEDLKERGIDRVDITRGMGWGDTSSVPDWAKEAKSGQVMNMPPLRPMSSWTVNDATADGFSSGGKTVILKASVPASSIMAWPRSGFGCLNEYELVALPVQGQVTVSSVGGYAHWV